MPTWTRADVHLVYEVHGEGPPVLLLAPGGMRSAIAFWARLPWNPLVELPRLGFRVIAMDQRNAGASVAPVQGTDGWPTYTADQLGLLDHLGIERCHLLGCCIGGPFALALAAAAPDRVASAVLLQPIGLSADNRPAFGALFDDWAVEVGRRLPDVDAATWSAYRTRMFGGEFVFAVTRDQVRRCGAPLLVLLGDDRYHPAPISREVVALAPQATLIEAWKAGDAVGAAAEQLVGFLRAHA